MFVRAEISKLRAVTTCHHMRRDHCLIVLITTLCMPTPSFAGPTADCVDGSGADSLECGDGSSTTGFNTTAVGANAAASVNFATALGFNSAASADMTTQIATLFEMVEAATQERSELLARVEELEQQLARSEPVPVLGQTDIISASSVTVSKLELAGIETYQATELVNLNEQMELDALALRDTATREGWLISDKYHTDSTRLLTTDNPLRLELGDEQYQQYLQSTDQPSQVLVETVLLSSSAAEAGLQAGDEIQHYAGRRIFSMAELQMASASESRDELVEVTVLRNGEIVQLYIAGGPLGIRATDSIDLAAAGVGSRMI